MRARVCSACLIAMLAIACGDSPSPLTGAEREAIAQEVRTTVNAFAEAERQMDVDALLSLLAPEFYMYGDGVRADHDTVVEQLRSTMATLQKFDTTWSDIEVTVLARDHALVSMVFQDSITLDSPDEGANPP